MNEPSTYERIEAYLAGSLTGTALDSFEKELNINPQLAKEVELHRKLQEELGDPIKRQLRGILEDIKKEERAGDTTTNIRQLRPKMRWQRRLAIAASFLLLAAAIGYFMLKNPVETPPIVDETPPPQQSIDPIEKTPESPLPDPVKETPNAPSNIANNDAPKDKPTVEKPPQKEEQSPIKKPAFDPFQPNAELENLMAVAPNSPFEFAIDFPEKNQVLTLRSDGKVQMGLLGTLFTSDFPKEEGFYLQLFDNQTNSLANEQPIFETRLSFEKEENPSELAYADEERGIYYVDFRERIEAKPGLYYWMIKLKNNDTIAEFGQLQIKELEK